MLRALGLLALAMLSVPVARALPLAHEEITRLCGEAEGLAHCGRLVETEQLKRLPGLATRDGNTLRVSLFPSGSAAFTDVETASGGTSFALWDHYSTINATLLFATNDDDASFILLQRATGKRTPLPSEPALAPDRQRFATADFCESRCENRIAIWRISREGISREMEWKPAEAWSDAAVRWSDAATLIVDYTTAGGESRSMQRKLGEAGWTPSAR